MDRNYLQFFLHLHASYQKRFNKELSFVVMGVSKDFLCISLLCRVGDNVCVHVCKTTNWRFICLIICNCIYIVVINCGWNNNVTIKIVACWNWNVYTSSWLDIHSEFVLIIHVRCESLNRRESCQIDQALSKIVCRSANLVSSIKVKIFKQ